MTRRRAFVPALLALLLLLTAAPALARGADGGGTGDAGDTSSHHGGGSEQHHGRGRGPDGSGPPGQHRQTDPRDEDASAPAPHDPVSDREQPREQDHDRQRDRESAPSTPHDGDAASSPHPEHEHEDPRRGGTADPSRAASSVDGPGTAPDSAAATGDGSDAGEGPSSEAASSGDEEASDEQATLPETAIRLDVRAAVARDEAGRKVVDPGELTSVTFHYTLRNTGDSPVTVIHLSDDALPDLSVEELSTTALAPGERAHATASLDLDGTPARTRVLSTAAMATAVTEDGIRVSDAASESLRLTPGGTRDGQAPATLAAPSGTTAPPADGHAAGSAGPRLEPAAVVLVLLLAAIVPVARRAPWLRGQWTWPFTSVRGSHAAR
jgi:hypothetical protein